MANPTAITTLGELRRAIKSGAVPRRSVHEEVRQNLIRKLRAGETLFPGIVGYDDTVVPQLVNALLSRHNFILLGLRGQAKTRLLRALVTLLDEAIPAMPGCEINDDPLAPICAACRTRIATEGDRTPLAWLARDARYVEKLATPDVTIADMVGDIDPIKAARSGLQLSSELTMHYGLLPRANRGIFAINELPDLAAKIQVGLFNILQEGDVQIKGYPVRLPLDVLMAFTANPEDYTARGKIITPLKDRIGSEIRTHYPVGRAEGMKITAQEAWLARDGSGLRTEVPAFVAEVVEEIAFQARQDRRIDKRSGVSQRLPISAMENVLSNAERRALLNAESVAVPRVTDVYAALPSITGKFELEYEGELKGAETIGRELIRAAVATVADGYLAHLETRRVLEWFDLGGSLQLSDSTSAEELLARAREVQGLVELAHAAGVPAKAPAPLLASGVDFVLEGLYALKKISRSEERGYHAAETPVRRPTVRETAFNVDPPMPTGGKKKYYN
ncbi:MAG: magnesium chelatase [Acidobacteria bacterium]|nr:magnesium chelatase [Acidobacteriota bacterium]